MSWISSHLRVLVFTRRDVGEIRGRHFVTCVGKPAYGDLRRHNNCSTPTDPPPVARWGCLLLCLAAGSVFADAAAVKHPVYPPPVDTSKWTTKEAYAGRADRVLAVPEDKMLAIIPEQNGFIFCGCPNCDGGAQENNMVWNGWDDPHRVHCRHCKMNFPNDQYPMTESFEAVDAKGVKRTWRYHKDADGNEYHFAARARYYAKTRFIHYETRDLASAYQVTGDKKYARRAAVILYRLAQVYPGWNVMNDYPAPGKKYPIVGAFPRKKYQWTGKLVRWWYGDIPTRLIKSYDMIYNSGELEKLSKEKGVDVKKIIERDLFHAAVAFLRDNYPLAYDNMSPLIYSGLIVAGRVLGVPDYVHDGIERARTLFETQFLFDGMWHEGSPSYHNQTVAWMDNVIADAKGYSDDKFTDFDMGRDIAIIRRARAVEKRLAFPDGRRVALHDTWAYQQPGVDPDGPGRSLIYNDYGHVRLGFGEGEDALQAHLHFSGEMGHEHWDDLSLVLYAKRRELLSDIGYTHGRWRFWTWQTQSHNTVAIDGKPQTKSKRSGDVQLLAIQDDWPVQAVEVSQAHAYPRLAKTCSRRLIAVRVDADDAYVVDIFRVKGGSMHEYFLHGNCDEQQTAKLNVALSPTPGTMLGADAKFRLPARESDRGEAPDGKQLAYALFRNLREAKTDGDLTVDWSFDNAQVGAKLRTRLFGQSGSRVILADTPQIRPMNQKGRADETKLDKHWRPSVVLQRKGEAPLESVFVAVHEPHDGKALIQSVTRDGDRIVVTHTAGRDVIDSPAQTRLSVRRAQGFHFEYNADAPVTGGVLEVNRKAEQLVVTDLPDTADLGSAIIVTHGDGSTHAYPIKSISRQGDKATIQLDGDPGFVIVDGETRFASYPQTKIAGPNRFRIDRVRITSAAGQ